MTSYGIVEDYEFNATHKQRRIIVWSGSFYGTYEATGIETTRGYVLTTYNGDKVRVQTFTRNEENYQRVDADISAALEAHYVSIGATSLIK